ncbi:MAG: hypothetical protein V4819_22655 [Verrucomicrobiota bacterium]
MKTVLCLVAMMFCLARLDASILRLDGDLTWNVTEPQCEFKLKGELQNLNGVGTGVIKLVLWATAAPYPSAGTIVGEFPLGQLYANESFSDFIVKTKANVPFLNGTFYFTIAVVEYTPALGWRNIMLVPTGTKALSNGDFVGQKKWIFPIAPVVAPPASIKKGNVITLVERATDERNAFPIGWRERVTLSVKGSSTMKFSNKSRDATIRYEYAVRKAEYRNKNVPFGKLVLSDDDNDDFKRTVSLFFQGPDRGTYKSVIISSLWGGTTFSTTTTWGTFKFE